MNLKEVKVKMKCMVLCLLLVIVVFMATRNSFAETQEEKLFIQKCAVCHKKGGKAPPVNPADKAAIVWEKYFKRHRHPIDLSKKISSSEMKIIIEYLKSHAADSDQPLEAVIPK